MADKGQVFARLFEEACRLQRGGDCERAEAIFDTLAEKRYPPAQVELAAYYRERGDSARAINLLQDAARQGFIQAQALLGYERFFHGSTEEDTKEGMELIRQAAARGDKLAKKWAGLLSLADGDFKQADDFFESVSEEEPGVLLVRGALAERAFNNPGAAKQFYAQADVPGVTDMHLLYMKFRCQSCRKGGGLKLKLCSVCKGPRYCGVVCQKRDWPQHKNVCGKK